MITLLNCRIHCCYVGHNVFKRALSTSQLKEYYAVLNVKKSSTPKEIKESFLKLSKIYHPDNRLTGSHIKFVKLKEAYDAIKNGPPSVSSQNYQPKYEEYDLSHKAHTRYREQERNYSSYDDDKRYGFGGPYANSSNPWEELMRDRQYRKQQQGFSNRVARPLANMTLFLAAISWIVIYSSILLIWDYNDNVKNSYAKHRSKHQAEYRAFDNYLLKKEEARLARRNHFIQAPPIEETKTDQAISEPHAPASPKTVINDDEIVSANRERPLVSPNI